MLCLRKNLAEVNEMERQIPKNVRQIGNVSGSPKIYVEDYVDTFFTQLCEKAGETPIGAFLVGDFQKTDEEEYVYIYGAVQMHELKMSGKDYLIDEDTWKHAYEDCKQYFEDGEMLGWFVAHAGVPLDLEDAVVKLHKKSFPRENSVFIMKDPVEQEEKYFVHQMNDLLEISGHYTYYEKNPCMQNYMISCRKKNGVCPTETVEDRAAKDFRSIVRDRGGRKHQRKTSRLMYAMSTCLVLIVLVMGVVTMNNMDKMKAVQSALHEMTGDSEKETKIVKENGKDAVLDGTDSGELTQVSSGNVQSEGIPEVSGGDPAAEDAGTAQQGAGDGSTETGDPAADGSVIPGGDPAADGSVVPEGEAAGDHMTGGSITGGSVTGGDAPAGEIFNGSDGVYIVEEGDTLAIISRKMYGDISHADAISRMNGLTDGNLIYIGQKLLLP